MVVYFSASLLVTIENEILQFTQMDKQIFKPSLFLSLSAINNCVGIARLEYLSEQLCKWDPKYSHVIIAKRVLRGLAYSVEAIKRVRE